MNRAADKVRLMLITTSHETMASFFLRQIAVLAEEGFEVHAVCAPDPERPALNAAPGVTVHQVAMSRQPHPLRDIASFAQLLRLMRRVRPEIVHAHTPKAGLLGMAAACIAGVPVRLYTIHGLPLLTRRGLWRRVLEFAERASCAFANGVYSVSGSLHELVLSLGLCPSKKLLTLGDGSCAGIDLERFDAQADWSEQSSAVRRTFGIPWNAVLLCFLGRIARDKGIAVLAAAWKQLAPVNPNLHLLIAGKSDASDPVPETVLSELRNEPRVHFTDDWVSEVPAVYAASDICVLPTFREGLSQVALEAGAMGVPIVSTRIPGLVSSVEDGVTGILVPSGEAAPFASAVARLVENPELRKQMGTAAQEHIRSRFAEQRVNQLWVEEYRELVSKPRNHLLRPSTLALIVCLCACIFGLRPAHAQGARATQIGFVQEFYGANAYTNPQASAFLQQDVINGLTITPPVSNGVGQLAAKYGSTVMLRLPDGASPAGMSDIAITAQATAFGSLAAQFPQLAFTWDLMPEWDQSGGSWVPAGRPSYSNLTKAAAHAKFLQYYAANYPALMKALAQPASQRACRLAAITDYPMNSFDAFQMGADLCMLERGIDELGDLSTGIAFLRGAARQFGRAWGIDLSSWRTSNGMATQFNNENVLLGGWSASYLARHYYAAFLAGANVIHNEAAIYSDPDGQSNPLAAATQKFADFALRRHPNVGTPAVSIAFLVDPDNGFDPKHGVYNQASAVWYGDIPYSPGDFMVDNVLRLAYPNFWLHGLAPEAPFANSSGVPNLAQFRAFLANGGDVRPYEPIPSTRWGDDIDIVNTAASAASLSQYKAIVLLGDVHLGSGLRDELRGWVENGGTLIINAAQLRPEDATLAGVAISNVPSKTGTTSRWVASGTGQVERPYLYVPVRNVNAQVLAVNEYDDAVVTGRAVGKGRIVLTTPLYLQPISQDSILTIGQQLLESIASRLAVAQVIGPPVEYSVNQASGQIIVGIINNSSSEWRGHIVIKPASSVTAVSEYIQDQPMQFNASATGFSIPAQVPAYGVRVVGISF